MYFSSEQTTDNMLNSALPKKTYIKLVASELPWFSLTFQLFQKYAHSIVLFRRVTTSLSDRNVNIFQ